MGEGAGMRVYSIERGKGILHSVESPCITGVVTVSSVSNAFASQRRTVRSPCFFFHAFSSIVSKSPDFFAGISTTLETCRLLQQWSRQGPG